MENEKNNRKPAGNAQNPTPPAPSADTTSGADIAAANAKLVEYAGKISFYTRAGSIVRNDHSVPGILVSDWMPTFGVARSIEDPVNLAMDIAYRTVRSKNSGARNYAPSDLGLIDLCLDSLECLWHDVVRVTRVINKYSALNQYWGEALVGALGYNYYDLVNHMPDLEYRLVVWAAKLSQIARIPTMNYAAAHRLLASQIFKDGEVSRAQIYAFRQRYYYFYDKADEAKGVSLLDRRDYGTSTAYGKVWGYNDIVAVFNKMLIALLQSEDFALITGDIEKTWADAAFIKLNTGDVSSDIEYVDSGAMKLAIMNATYVGDIAPDSFRLKDVQGHFEYDPFVVLPPYDSVSLDPSTTEQELAQLVYYPGNIINSIVDEPSAVDVSGMLRFNTRVDYAHEMDNLPMTEAARSHRLVAFGTEVLISFQIIRMTATGTITDTNADLFTNMYYSQDSMKIYDPYMNPTPGYTGALDVLADIAQFDWHPAVNMIPVKRGAVLAYAGNQYKHWEWRMELPMFDLQVYALVDDDVVRNIHEARTLTCLGITQ